MYISESITIIGMPIRAESLQHADNIIKLMQYNFCMLPDNFLIVVDTNGTSSEVNRRLANGLKSSTFSHQVLFFPHNAQTGKTASMNRIARLALQSEFETQGVIYLSDNILLCENALKSLSDALATNSIVGCELKYLDKRDFKDTTLIEYAILDFEYKRKKSASIHGSLFGISKRELLEFEKEGLFPDLHFEDTYLVIRHKLKYGEAEEIPMIAGCQGYCEAPKSWSATLAKIARYNQGNRQIIDYFRSNQKEDTACKIAAVSSDREKALAQFTKDFHCAQSKSEILSKSKYKGPDIELISELWDEIFRTQSTELPDQEELTDILCCFLKWNPLSSNYSICEPETIFPVINSIAFLIGTHCDDMELIRGSSWQRDRISQSSILNFLQKKTIATNSNGTTVIVLPSRFNFQGTQPKY